MSTFNFFFLNRHWFQIAVSLSVWQWNFEQNSVHLCRATTTCGDASVFRLYTEMVFTQWFSKVIMLYITSLLLLAKMQLIMYNLIFLPTFAMKVAVVSGCSSRICSNRGNRCLASIESRFMDRSKQTTRVSGNCSKHFSPISSSPVNRSRHAVVI